jgi:hypothetical protein
VTSKEDEMKNIFVRIPQIFGVPKPNESEEGKEDEVTQLFDRMRDSAYDLMKERKKFDQQVHQKFDQTGQEKLRKKQEEERLLQVIMENRN